MILRGKNGKLPMKFYRFLILKTGFSEVRGEINLLITIAQNAFHEIVFIIFLFEDVKLFAYLSS